MPEWDAVKTDFVTLPSRRDWWNLAGGVSHRTAIRKTSPPRQGRRKRGDNVETPLPGLNNGGTFHRWLTPPANFRHPFRALENSDIAILSWGIEIWNDSFDPL